MEQLLIKLGLSDKEAKVYLACLELGEDTVQNISIKSKVNRATTYVIIEKLLKLGLVSLADKDKTKYVAENPEELDNILKEQEEAIEKKRNSLKESLTQLMAVYNKNRDKPIVRYFEGADGLEALDRYGNDKYSNINEALGFAPIDLIEESFPQRRRKAVDERVKHNIKSRVIYTHKNGEIENFDNKKELRESVYLPRNKFPLNSAIQIYPNWGVKFFNYNNNRFFGVLVESSELSEAMKLIFELSWKTAKQESNEK